MIDLPEVVKVIKNYLKTSNRNVAYMDYSTLIQDYLAWYRGKTKWHTYNVFNGENSIECQRSALCMAKTVCEDLASLELNEKCKIKLADDLSQAFIDDTLSDNNFAEQGNQLVELTNALGTGAFVTGIGQEGDLLYPQIDYIHGDMIFPLKWDNGIITECAFVKIGGNNQETEYTVISHVFEEGRYLIKTAEIDKKGKVVKPLDLTNANINDIGEIVYDTKSPIQLFQIIKPNIVNNYDKTNPLGMSIFGNAIDILKSIDTIYDSWNNEFVLGKKRIFVKSDLKKVVVNPGDGVQSQIDANDVLFYQLDWTGKDNDKPPIYETQMTIRANEHIESIDKQLNLLSRKVGLGDNFYAFNNGSIARTATEVISTNSSLFRNLKKHELVLERALKGLVRALLQIGNMLGVGNFDVYQEISIDFDDSIIEDTEKEKTQALTEYNAGLIDKVEYFVLTRNMTREQAIKFIAEMQATDTMKEVSSILNNFGGGF